MSQITQVFLLVGIHAGKDLAINGRDFVEGRYEFTGTALEVQNLTNLFSYYGAMPEAEAELFEALNGETPATAVGSTDKTPPAVVVDPKPSLAEAIGLLDPENDAHWTSNNLPAIDFLEGVTGSKVTRAEVEAVAEGFTRAKARALA